MHQCSGLGWGCVGAGIEDRNEDASGCRMGVHRDKLERRVGLKWGALGRGIGMHWGWDGDASRCGIGMGMHWDAGLGCISVQGLDGDASG